MSDRCGGQALSLRRITELLRQVEQPTELRPPSPAQDSFAAVEPIELAPIELLIGPKNGGQLCSFRDWAVWTD
jgi:hypothetical protein